MSSNENIRPQPSGETREVHVGPRPGGVAVDLPVVRPYVDMTMQDIRLHMGEGKLKPEDVLKAANIIVQNRLPDLRPQPSGETRALIGRLTKALDDATTLPGVKFYPHVLADDLRAILALIRPSPTPAADANRVRIAVEALERIKSRKQTCASDAIEAWELQDIASAALSALKSTAAKEGGEV